MQMSRQSSPTPSFRFPGVLNSQQLLVAEAACARAWELLSRQDRAAEGEAAKARLGSIVVRLILERTQPGEDLALAAIKEFERR